MTDIGDDVSPAVILAFWRAAGSDRWYKPDDAFDADLRRRFFGLWRKAAAGELSCWEATDDGALALVIVLDQFPRNMFRGDVRTYSSDALALEVANRAIARGVDRGIAADLAEFLYLPLMHSEHLADQQRCVELFRNAGQCRQPEIRRGSCRYHPPVRALSPPQLGAGTHRRRRKNRPFSTAADFPADDGTVNDAGHCRFRATEYCARRLPGLRNIGTLQGELTMTIKVGDKLPEAKFRVMTAEGPQVKTTDDIFKGKKVALFAVPGAYTGTCHKMHLPSIFLNAYAIKDKGVNTIAIVSVNDAFVMNAWKRDTDQRDEAVFLADGNAEFTKAIGMELDASGNGLGIRSHRYSMLVDDGVVKKLNLEPAPGKVEVSGGDTLLGQL